MLKLRSKIDVFLVVGVSTKPPICACGAMWRVIGDPRMRLRRRAAHQAIYTSRLLREIGSLKRRNDVCRIDDGLAD